MPKKKTTKGRPTGSRNLEPRVKRALTPIQKLREHVLIELGVDKQDIASALGLTRQTVSNVFLDVHRSEAESQIVAFLRHRYDAADRGARDVINSLVLHANFSGNSATDWENLRERIVSRETMGWPKMPHEALP